MDFARFPRARLCHCPTPLEPMENLSRLLGGPALYVKRDDCTGLATGGNKTRKLDFLMGEALALGADTVITQGAVQSNHVRQTAAAACKLGLETEILLERRVPDRADDYETTGNVFLDRLCGARIDFLPGGTDMAVASLDRAEQVRERGGKPYVIPGGGSNHVGALGYAHCALELLYQASETGLRIDYVVHGTGSGGTQSGLVAGFEGCNSGIKVYGVSVRQPEAKQQDLVHGLANEVADHLGVRAGVARESVLVTDAYVGPGYGQPTPEMVDAVNLAARHEGLLLDPVYSGKGMAGLIGLIRDGVFAKDENVVFLHTGGSAALFAYQDVLLSRPPGM